jgi:hypothetical protein
MFLKLTSTLFVYEIIYFLIFALYCIVDLRFRTVSSIWIFFAGALLLSVGLTPIRTLFVILALGWGLSGQLNFLLVPLFFYPPVWPVLLWGYGYSRSGYPPIIDKADLLVMASVACLYPWPASISCVLGVQLWRLWWRQRYKLDTHLPGLPGFLIGLALYLTGDILLSQFAPVVISFFGF